MRRTSVTLWLIGALLAGACGSPTPQGRQAVPDQAFPVEVLGVTIGDRPERIVSLSATHTEILYAIGAGDGVVATDLTSDHPPEALETDKLDAFQPSVEAIAARDPDLVIAFFDPGDLVAGLAALGIPTLLFEAPADLDGAYAQIEQLGVATGHLAEAAALVASMQQEIEEIVASAPVAGRTLTYYHELDPTYYTVTSATFLGRVYALFGMESIADPVGPDNPYPQLSSEYIVDADPDLIFLADTKCCDVTAESVAGRPGWSVLTAVRRGAVVELDDDLASRWGPRVVDLVRAVSEGVAALESVP